MSSENLTAVLTSAPLRRAAARLEHHRSIGSDLGFGLLVIAVSTVAAALLSQGHERPAIAIGLLPVLGWLIARPAIPLVLLGASLPVAIVSVANAGSRGHISMSDLLMVFAGAGVLFTWLAKDSVPTLRSLRPVAVPVLIYGGAMFMVLALHPGLRETAKFGQRLELFVLPLILGAFAALTDRHIRLLQAYILGATALAALWPLDTLGMQHNPVGQFIGNAVLLLLGVRRLRRLAPCLLFLVPGLVLTFSRGAIAATLVGALVILAMQRLGTRPVLRRVMPAIFLALGAFTLAPSAIQTRVLTFSSGKATPGQYSIYLRQQAAQDAHRIIDEHPWTGVGIGNYGVADAAINPQPAQDPHQVLLQQEAEGGYPFAAIFVLLIVATMLALRRMRHVDLAPVAAGVFIATVAHGLVDIYWVRGTPVLSWLLVGMACGELMKLRNERRPERA
jgi:O-antigen ligase